MIIRKDTTKARRADKTTGRGCTKARRADKTTGRGANPCKEWQQH